MVNVAMSTAPLGEHSRIEQQHAGGAARDQRRNHATFEPENGDGRFYRKQKRPGIDARELGRVERKRTSVYRLDFAENRVDGEPNREVEDDAYDGRRDCRE
jgi:hypothetical protein